MLKIAQHPIDQVYLNIRCAPPPTLDLEGQGTGCRTGRPVHPSKPFACCSVEQLGRVRIENFTDGLNGAVNAEPSRCEAHIVHYTTMFPCH